MSKTGRNKIPSSDGTATMGDAPLAPLALPTTPLPGEGPLPPPSLCWDEGQLVVDQSPAVGVRVEVPALGSSGAQAAAGGEPSAAGGEPSVEAEGPATVPVDLERGQLNLSWVR